MLTAPPVRPPVVVQPSPSTYGPDGRWNAVRVYFDPDQHIDLLPWGTGRTTLLNSTYCANNQGYCNAKDAGLYDQSRDNSSLALPIWLDASSQLVMSTLSFNPNATASPLAHVANQSINVISRSSSLYPFGLVDDSIGNLDVGGCVVNNTVDGQYVGNSPPSYLFQTGSISSASFHLHVGATSPSIPMSMMYGGYDSARILGSAIVGRVGVYTIFSLILNDISIRTAYGASPFPSGDVTGLLAKDNDTIASSKNGYEVFVSIHTPYLQFPPSVCTAIAENLPVIYDKSVGLYLWNTGDAQYARILSAPTYLSFALSNNSHQLTINVPFQLLNLTLESPLKDEPTQYFPCNPLSSENHNVGWFNKANGIGSPTLGRAFLQAASLGVNWAPKDPPDCNSSLFWLAQAPGPDFASPTLRPLIGDSLNVQGIDDSWESTWQRHWQPYINGTHHGLSKTDRIGLSVGLGLGGLVLLILGTLTLLLRQSRMRRTRIDETRMKREGLLYEQDSPAELTGSKSRIMPPELLDEFKDRAEMDEQRRLFEIGHVLEVHELQG